MAENVKAIVERFPDMFDVTEDTEFCVPVGWLGYLENALNAFQATGVQVKISGIRIESGILRAVDSSYSRGRGSAGVTLLNAFIAGAGKLCIYCGKPLTTCDWEIQSGRIGA